MNRVNAPTMGALAGAAFGVLLLIFPFPQLLAVLILAAIGYAIGKLMESRELRAKLKEMFSLFVRRS